MKKHKLTTMKTLFRCLIRSSTSRSAQHATHSGPARLGIVVLTVIVAIGCITCFVRGIRGTDKAGDMVCMATEEDNNREVLNVKWIEAQATSAAPPSFGLEFHRLYAAWCSFNFLAKSCIVFLLPVSFFFDSQVDRTPSFVVILDQKVHTVGLKSVQARLNDKIKYEE